MYRHLISLALLLLVTLPLGVPASLVLLAQDDLSRGLLLLLAPALAIAIYVGICIAFARLGMKAIIPGKFPRQLNHKVYGPRRLYGTMWTAVYYLKPLYWLLLSSTWTKRLLLRGFGYQGNIGVTTYPDTWIRDLPLLRLGEGAYLANKATMGTNMCLADGSIIVDAIEIGDHSIVGHLCMTSPGVTVGKHSELGAGAVVGINVKIGDYVSIGPTALINHGARIADHVKVGAACHIGAKAQILAEGLEIPPSVHIPAHAIIRHADDLQAILAFQRLHRGRSRLEDAWAQ